jgi:hypothetical protein
VLTASINRATIAMMIEAATQKKYVFIFAAERA